MKQTHAVTKRQDYAMSIMNSARHGDADWLKQDEYCKQAWFAYIKTHKLPEDIPTRPDLVYANVGWMGWQDWLGSFDSKGKGGQE